jgi:hypothetical protein
MTGRPRRSPLRGSQLHAWRAQLQGFNVQRTTRTGSIDHVADNFGHTHREPPKQATTTFLAHPTRSHTRRSAAHWRAIHPRTVSRPWTSAAYSGARPPPMAPPLSRPPLHPQSGCPQLRAATSQRCTGERRRRGLTAPSQHLPAPPHPFCFKQPGSHRDHASGATTTTTTTITPRLSTS